jgi:photosystem II stability/assembly factor-like uncharacterized protein
MPLTRAGKRPYNPHQGILRPCAGRRQGGEASGKGQAMSVCLSPGGRNLYVTQAPESEVLVGTADGVVRLRRAAPDANWTVAERALQGKHVSAILVEPNRGVIFAGTHGDGLYESEDQGATWERRDAGLDQSDVYSLNCVEIDGELLVYAGTEPAHLYVSADLGASWRELPALRTMPSVDKWTFPAPPNAAHVKNINFDPLVPTTVYAAVEVGGLFKSQDGGETFRELSGFYEDVHRTVFPAGQSDCLYISTGNGIYRTLDAGESWEHLTDRSLRIGYPDALIVHPERPELMFTAGAINSPGVWYKTRAADPRIARSRDGGRTWEFLGRGLPEHIHGNTEAMSMNAWRGGFCLFVGTTDGEVFYSEDEGETWSIIAAGLPAISKRAHYRILSQDPREALPAHS